MDWDKWHTAYEDSAALQARLEKVCAELSAVLEACQPREAGKIRLVSLCAGDGRDVIGAVAGHRRRAEVLAWLMDMDAASLVRGRAAAEAAGLQGQVAFRLADAGRGASYVDIGRCDVVLLSGFLGHLRHADADKLMRCLPMLLHPGGWVIWSRHQVMNDGRRQVPALRELLSACGFEETHFSTTGEEGFAIGRASFTGEPVPLDPQAVFFEFGSIATGGSPGHDPAGNHWINPEQSIPACFDALAAAHPDRAAIGTGGWQPTYAELRAAADAVAQGLAAAGGFRGDRVAILMRHDGPLIAAILGVLKAGRVVVALNPTDPPVRLTQLLAHADPSVLLADQANYPLAESLATDSMHVVKYEACAATRGPSAPVNIAPTDLAWLIFTSGTTGAPKAVMQTHRNILHNAMRNAQGLGMRPDDRAVLLASPSGGQGVGTIWCTLLQGATLCPFAVMERGATELATWMTEQRITVYVSATSVFRNFMKTLDAGACLAGVRMVRLASEPATFDDLVAFRRHFGRHCLLLQTLSSSETGNITQCRLGHHEPITEGRLPVGLPAEGIEMLLVDEHGGLVADGEVGEVVVRSRHLSPGYWRNAALTAERFSDGPSAADPRQYRMGDLARRLPDGRLMYMGRKDGQVKIHGFRIEVSEIEAALERQPEVERAAVCARTPEEGTAQLVAYVVWRARRSASVETLRAALRSSLPGHMIPAVFVFLGSFPLNAGGKIDRTRLPAPPPPAARANRPKVRRPARDNVEKALAAIWEDVLGLPGIGWDENFFDLGGDSLQALAIAARIEKEFGQLPPLAIFLDAGTIAAQAEAMCQGWTAQRSTVVPLNAGGSGPPLYCVHGAGGEVFSFSALARCLAPQHAVFGLQSPGLLGEWPPTTLQAFARRHAREILAHDATGPCLLLGHCAGGLLALEIARQLAQAGKPVELVALIDTLMPGIHPEARSNSRRRRFTDAAAHRFRTLRWRARLQFENLFGRPTSRFSAPYRRFADYAFKQALRHHALTSFKGPVAAFMAETPLVHRGVDVRDMLVRGYVPQAKVFHIPGTHAGCLRQPHVETLAATLRPLL